MLTSGNYYITIEFSSNFDSVYRKMKKEGFPKGKPQIKNQKIF